MYNQIKWLNPEWADHRGAPPLTPGSRSSKCVCARSSGCRSSPSTNPVCGFLYNARPPDEGPNIRHSPRASRLQWSANIDLCPVSSTVPDPNPVLAAAPVFAVPRPSTNPWFTVPAPAPAQFPVYSTNTSTNPDTAPTNQNCHPIQLLPSQTPPLPLQKHRQTAKHSTRPSHNSSTNPTQDQTTTSANSLHKIHCGLTELPDRFFSIILGLIDCFWLFVWLDGCLFVCFCLI